MDPSTLIPTPDTLPVSWGWFQLLLVITLFLHIIVMNVMLGTAVIALVSHFRAGRETVPLARAISRKLPFAVAFAVNFGIAPLLFVQVLYGHFLYSSSVLMANFWLFVIAFLILGYYAAYVYDYKFEPLGDSRIAVIGLAVFCMLAIGFLMSNNFTMMQVPEVWTRYFERPAGFLLNLGDPSFWPRYLHIMTSAIAVGGMSIALYYELRRRRGDADAGQWIRTGCNWFGSATIMNFGFGFWFFSALPTQVRDTSTFSGAMIAFLLFSAVILGALAVIYSFRGRVFPMLSTSLATVFIMLLIRDLARVGYLKPWFSLSDLEVAPQYSPLFLFLVFFAAGLWLVWKMFRLAAQAIDTEEVQS